MVGKVKIFAFLLSVSTILAGVSGGTYFASTVLPSDTAADAVGNFENTSSKPENGLSATKVTSEAAAEIAAKFMAAQSSSSETSSEENIIVAELPETSKEVVEEAVKEDPANQSHDDDVIPDRGQTGGGDSGIISKPGTGSGDTGIAPEPSNPSSGSGNSSSSSSSSSSGNSSSSGSSSSSSSTGSSSNNSSESQKPSYSDGWQTIGGSTYYYKNGKPLTGWQVFDYGKPVTGSYNSDGSIYYVEDMSSYRRYFFDSNGVLSTGNAIDVSYAQGSGINWNQVKADGIDYAMIRCAYRGYSTGELKEDSTYWVQNVRNAQAAGIQVGLYFYTNAINTNEAKEEAAYILELLNKYNLSISGPICIDIETICYRTMNNTNAQQRTDIVRAFCNYISANGYRTKFYTNYDFAVNDLKLSQLSDLDLWLASYNSSSHFLFTNFESVYGHRIDIWQYSSKNRVSGISGNVDMNVVRSW